METNFISAIEIMTSASMDFLKFNTETGQPCSSRNLRLTIIGNTEDSWKSIKVLGTHFEHFDLTAYTVNGKSISQ